MPVLAVKSCDSKRVSYCKEGGRRMLKREFKKFMYRSDININWNHSHVIRVKARQKSRLSPRALKMAFGYLNNLIITLFATLLFVRGC